nr:MAG TPA: hypothetical protein [Caudoviricetes sp.]
MRREVNTLSDFFYATSPYFGEKPFARIPGGFLLSCKKILSIFSYFLGYFRAREYKEAKKIRVTFSSK